MKLTFTRSDGDAIRKGEHFGDASGRIQSLLVAERLALNIMQRMSGIATQTRLMVDAMNVPGSSTRLLDTRKTAPGLRVLDRDAVVHGGGINHRFGLFDMFLIKDNHSDACGGVDKAIKACQAARERDPNLRDMKIVVEVRTEEELRLALSVGGIDRVLLDNMVSLDADGSVNTSRLEAALQIVAQSSPRVDTEASGNVTLATVGAIARCNPTFISSGALTHSVTALDISMKISHVE